MGKMRLDRKGYGLAGMQLPMLVALLLFSQFAFAAPQIGFSSGSASNGGTYDNGHAKFNVSINESDIGNFTWEANGTNYTVYDDSLVLMMNFDNSPALGESSASNFTADVSEYGNNGTCVNMSSACNWTTGKYGSALRFNGMDTFVQVPNAPEFEPQTFSVEAWVKFYGPGTQNVLQTILTKGRGSAPLVSYGLIYWGDLGEFAWAIGGTDGTDEPILSSRPLYGLATHRWNHVVGTYDGSTSKLYVNGVLESSSLISKTVYYGFDSTHIAPYDIPGDAITMGMWGDGPWDYPLNGSIDEVRVYNRTLSADEIKQHYVSNLYKYDTGKWQFYARASRFRGGTFKFSGYAKDGSGAMSSTGERTINIINTSLANFEGDGTTDFGAAPSLAAVHSATLEDPEAGKIVWSGDTDCRDVDFDSYVTMQDNYIAVDTAHLGVQFNKSADVTFYNVPAGIGVPEVFIDDGSGWRQCTDCSMNSVAGSTYTVFVPHFSAYKIAEGTALAAWDSSDAEGGNQLIIISQMANFYANYSNASGAITPAMGGMCNISFEDSADNNMTYNAGTGRYEYSRSFSDSSSKQYNVSCAGTVALDVADSIDIKTSGPMGFGQVNIRIEATNQISVYANDSGDTINFINTTIPAEGQNFSSDTAVDMKDSVTGFTVENQGNVAVTLQVSSNVTADDFIGGTANGGPKFQYWSDEPVSGNCDVLNGTKTTPTDFATSNTWVCSGTGLKYQSGTDKLYTYIHVYVPSDAPPGQKNAILTFTSTAA